MTVIHVFVEHHSYMCMYEEIFEFQVLFTSQIKALYH